MRPPRLRCTLFPLIYPPHLLGSYKRQLYGFVLFSRLTKRNLASYVISVRRTKSLLTASFRFYLTIDTLAVQLYTSLSPRRVRDFHPLERAHGAQTKISPAIAWLTIQKFIIFYCPLDGEHTIHNSDKWRILLYMLQKNNFMTFGVFPVFLDQGL